MKDGFLLALYVITLFIIVVGLFDFWLISIIFMLLLIISLVQKVSAEEKIDKLDKNRGKLITLVTERLDAISGKTEAVRNDINRNMFVMESRIAEVRHTYEKEMENYYRELARKIFDIENKLNSVKKTVGAAYGSLDERLQRVEDRRTASL